MNKLSGGSYIANGDDLDLVDRTQEQPVAHKTKSVVKPSKKASKTQQANSTKGVKNAKNDNSEVDHG